MKTVKTHISILILFCLNTAVFAQTDSTSCSLSGVISLSIEGIENIPIDENGALVWVEGSDEPTATDSLGRFKFDGLEPGIKKFWAQIIFVQSLDTTIVLESGDVNTFNFASTAKCFGFDPKTARLNIDEGNIRLLLAGGIAPFANNSHDDQYEKDFSLTYHDFGCEPPSHYCMISYNKVVFEYLDKKYGDSWREGVRKDVIGLKSYLKDKQADASDARG